MESSQFTDRISSFESFEPLDTQGATCETFRVKLYGKLHFLKRLKVELAGDIRCQEAFRKEFETGYRLEHPNLVRYISLTDDGILMEYIDGETLTQRFARQPEFFKDRKNTQKFVRQLLDAVGYLHSQQVLHLDLKPDNILLTRINNDVKLIDLGCCYTDRFTDTQGRTNRFAAPEQFSGAKPDVRTDIFAIGRILELLPCHHIYNKVIARCTAEDPLKRYQSVGKITRQLNHAKTRKHAFMLLGIIAAVLLLVTLFYVGQPREESTLAPPTPVSVSPQQQDTSTPTETIQSHEAPPTSSPFADNAVSNIEILRRDIRKSILPKFNVTVGALPDSVMPSTEEWANACREFEPMITQSLKELITSHQSIPMETIAKEYNDYIQSLITLKMNQAKGAADN